MEDINPADALSEVAYAAPVVRAEHAEGSLTRLVEEQTAKVPSHYFLFAAFVAMALSMGAEVVHRSRVSRFIGMWPAPLLVMGTYNKIVKLLGPR